MYLTVVCMHICMHACIHGYVCMYACTYVCTYVRTYERVLIIVISTFLLLSIIIKLFDVIVKIFLLSIQYIAWVQARFGQSSLRGRSPSQERPGALRWRERWKRGDPKALNYDSKM